MVCNVTNIMCIVFLLQDALKYENGKDLCGSSIIVEWARGNPRPPQRRVNTCNYFISDILQCNHFSLKKT